jgi:fructose/tagatose bisphosphate aldolase
MAIVPFQELVAAAEAGNYAVGYFESWNLESLLAVADAAEAVRSPVMLGFSGIQLSNPGDKKHLRQYAALGLETCRNLGPPCCLVFNECPSSEVVSEAIELGFGLVMFSDPALGVKENMENVRETTRCAHATAVAVEGELVPLPGMGGDLYHAPQDLPSDDPHLARTFVEYTGIDAFAVNVGQVHLHGRSRVRLDLEQLSVLRDMVPVPLVLHGASSVCPEDLVEAIRLGIRKINVGSILRRTYLDAVKASCACVAADYNPYEVVGSRLPNDVLEAGRLALQRVVQDWMVLFGSAGKA